MSKRCDRRNRHSDDRCPEISRAVMFGIDFHKHPPSARASSIIQPA
jgi:hypothetical protein